MLFRKKQIEIYTTSNGKAPFILWIEALEKKIRYRIKERLGRVALGNMGDHKQIDYRIFEMRFAIGPGYHTYYANLDKESVLLLCGGDKSSQIKDIQKAIGYWKDYLSRLP